AVLPQANNGMGTSGLISAHEEATVGLRNDRADGEEFFGKGAGKSGVQGAVEIEPNDVAALRIIKMPEHSSEQDSVVILDRNGPDGTGTAHGAGGETR